MDIGHNAAAAQSMTQPCYTVSIPQKPFEICMQCTNPKPVHASYIWTPDWYKDFQCNWECNTGYSGVTCSSLLPFDWWLWPLVVIVSATLALALSAAAAGCRKAPKPPPEEPEPLVVRPQMVQFREEVISHQQIRVKIQ